MSIFDKKAANSRILPNKLKIVFYFSDKTSIEYDYNLVNFLNPITREDFKNFFIDGKYRITLPDCVLREDLNELLFLYLNQNEQNNNEAKCQYKQKIEFDKKKINSYLELLLFLRSEQLDSFAIKNIFIPEINDENVIDFFLFSYKAIKINKPKDNSYLNLFNVCFEYIAKNEKYIINNYEKLKIMETSILKNIIVKLFFNLFNEKCILKRGKNFNAELNNNIELNEITSKNENLIGPNELCNKYININESKESKINPKSTKSYNLSKYEGTHILKYKDYVKLIKIIMDLNEQNNFFDLLSLEYINILSRESNSISKEFNENYNDYHKKNKTYFQKNISVNLFMNNCHYEEYPLGLSINNSIVVIIIFYQPLDNTFNISIKLSDKDTYSNINSKVNDPLTENEFCFQLISFYIVVQLSCNTNPEKSIKKNIFVSIAKNKSMYNILKIPINHLDIKKNSLNDDDLIISVKAKFKICYLYSGLISYLLQDFSNFNTDNNISKLSKQSLILILNNKYVDKKKEDDIIKSLILWLNDEVNIREDISEILFNINWKQCNDALIFELIIKYSHFILSNDNLQRMFYNIFQDKYGDSIIIKNIIQNFFIASNKIQYSKIFTKMEKNNKLNNAYICYNSYLNISNNIEQKKSKEIIKKESSKLYEPDCGDNYFKELQLKKKKINLIKARLKNNRNDCKFLTIKNRKIDQSFLCKNTNKTSNTLTHDLKNKFNKSFKKINLIKIKTKSTKENNNKSSRRINNKSNSRINNKNNSGIINKSSSGINKKRNCRINNKINRANDLNKKKEYFSKIMTRDKNSMLNLLMNNTICGFSMVDGYKNRTNNSFFKIKCKNKERKRHNNISLISIKPYKIKNKK